MQSKNVVCVSTQLKTELLHPAVTLNLYVKPVIKRCHLVPFAELHLIANENNWITDEAASRNH